MHTLGLLPYSNALLLNAQKYAILLPRITLATATRDFIGQSQCVRLLCPCRRINITHSRQTNIAPEPKAASLVVAIVDVVISNIIILIVAVVVVVVVVVRFVAFAVAVAALRYLCVSQLCTLPSAVAIGKCCRF